MEGPNYGAGSGAASALQDILIRRKAEEQRAIQNAQASEEFKHRVVMDEDAAATNKMLREAQAENQKYLAGQRFLSQFHRGQEVAPDAYAQANKLGVGSAFDGGLAPVDPSFVGPLQEDRPREGRKSKYLGSPQEIGADENRERMLQWLDSPEGAKMNPNVRDALKAQAMAEKFGAAIPAGAYSRAAEEKEIAILLPDNTFLFKGQKVKTVPPGTDVQRGFQPAGSGNSGYNWSPMYTPDPLHPNSPGIPFLVDLHSGNTKPVQMPSVPAPAPNTTTSAAGDVSLPNVSGASDPRLTVQQPATTMIRTPPRPGVAKPNLDETKIIELGRIRKLTIPAEQKAQAEYPLVTGMISEYPGITPAFKRTIANVYDHRDSFKGMSNEQIIAFLNSKAAEANQAPIDSTEADALNDLLPVLLGRP